MPRSFDFLPVVRRLRREDIPRVAEMSGEMSAAMDDRRSSAPLDAAMLSRALGTAPELEVLVAESEGRLIGYGVLHALDRAHSGRRGLDLQQLFVVKGWRGKGVGGWLLEQACDHARRLGCHDLSVSPAADGADGFYVRCGFTAGPVSRFHKVVAEAAVA